MNSTEQKQMELSAVLNLVPYLDNSIECYGQEKTLSEIVSIAGEAIKDTESSEYKVLQTLAAAIKENPSYGNVVMVDQSSTNSTKSWKDDWIQACTFKDTDGNYYVAYRGTGDGRWPDNGDGMTEVSTPMQEAAQEYFDKVAEKYFIDAKANGKQIIVTGHSKGGNEAQYVYFTSKYAYLIDYCYSYDGQGFSRVAIETFIDKCGGEEKYNEKLSRMYSICGENDFVHDLGFVIIPEENTYFVKTTGTSPVSFHSLECMLTGENGEFSGLQWAMENGKIVNGEQGYVGKFAKKLSEKIMQLDDENLHGVAVAAMTLADIMFGNGDSIMGDIKADLTDYIDLLAHGLPTLFETVFLTEEGQTLIKQLIADGVNKLYDNLGAVGTVAGFAIIGLILICNMQKVLSGVLAVVKVTALVIAIANILDFAVDIVNKLGIPEKLQKIISDIKNIATEIINAIAEKIEALRKSLNKGYKYATENPYISVDTKKMHDYANRLSAVNTRITTLDRMMNGLYNKVGLRDLWNLLQADILTGYSRRIATCETYLNDTATAFENAEREIVSQL